MFQVHDSFTLNVKRNSRAIRHLLVGISGLLIVLSIAYGFYWSLAMNGDIVIEFTQQYFSPIVSLFFEDITNLENYRITGMYLFMMSAPFIIAQYLVQKMEEIIIAIHQKKTEARKRAERIEIEKEKEKEFTDISSYSICVSMDVSDNKNLSPDYGRKLQDYVAKILTKELHKISSKIEVYNHRAILVYSKDFMEYDNIYGEILKQLKNVKNILGDNMEFIPTITTDAYYGECNPEKTIRQHFDIVKCNLDGRSTATALFRKKYTHLYQNKYAGTPIGLYTTFEGANYKEYDLNVIHKNLNRTLTGIL